VKLLIIVAGIIFGVLLGWILLLTISSLLVDPRKEYKIHSSYYRFLLNVSSAAALFFGRIHVHVNGLDNVPKTERFLLVSNHRSKFDPIITWTVLRDRQLAFISKEENFHVLWFGRIIRRCLFLSIDRENARKAMDTIKRAIDLIDSDQVSIGLYPEGTRSKDCTLLPFHNGVFKIAQRSEVPIVVMTIQGTEDIHVNYPFHPTNVQVDFLRVMAPEEIISMRTNSIGEEVKNTMLASHGII